MYVREITTDINNGERGTTGNYKSLVLTNDFKVKEVERVNYRGDPELRSTFQRAASGDIVLSKFWAASSTNRISRRCSMMNYNTVSKDWEYDIIDVNSGVDPWGMLSDDIIAWFEDSEDFKLPVGEAWDGVNTASEIRKRVRIERWLGDAIKEEWAEELITKAMRSPAAELPLRWSEANPMSEAVELDCSDFVPYKGKSARVIVLAWKRDKSYVCTMIDRTFNEGDKVNIRDMTKNVTRMAVIVLDAFSNAKVGRYGVKWTLYSTQPNLTRKK